MQRRLGHRDRHVARVGAKGRRTRQANRTRHPGSAADDEHRARAVLVVLGPLARHERKNLGRDQLQVRRGELEPDVGDDGLAGVKAARRDSEPGLETVERHGDRRPDCVPRDLAGRRVDARGHVDGDHRCRGGVDPLDRRRRVGARLAVEARAEQRVDDHVGLLDGSRLDGVEALVPQNPRRDPPVAPVRTAAADDGHPVRIGEELQHLAGDRSAGPLHQLRRGLRIAGIPLLGRAHLGRRVERLKHR